MKPFGLLLLALLSALVLADDGVTDTEILLGQSAALSGPTGELGTSVNRGAKAYFDWINAHGGVNGRKIRLVALDDGYEPDRAEANTKQLINNDHVFALVGYVGTPTSNASLPIVTQAKIPFIAPFTGADSLRTPFNRYIFNLRASYRDEAKRAAETMLRTGQRTVNIFYQDDAYGKAGLTAMQAAAAEKGIQIIATATVKRNTVDVANAVDQLITKNPATAIFMVTAYKSSAAFIKAARAKGVIGPFYNVSFVGTESLTRALDMNGGGVVVTQVLPSPYSAVLPATLDYQRVMEASGNKQFDYPSLEGYFAARLTVEGLKRAGRGLTRERLVSALEELGDHDMGGYRIKLSPSNHNGSHFVELTVVDKEGHIRS